MKEVRERRISIRPVLILLLIVQIGVVGSLIGWLSLRNGRESVQDMANDLLSKVAAVIEEQVSSYLKVPQLVNAINEDEIRLNHVNMDDFTSLAHNPWSLQLHMWKQIKIFKVPYYINMANERGDFIGVAQRTNGEPYMQVRDRSTRELLATYDMDERGGRKRYVLSEHYDPRTRPWYIDAKRQRKVTWTDTYPFFDKGKIGVTAVQPYINSAGSLRGVFSTDILVSYFSNFMRTLKIGKTGRAFIIERRGYLVGASTTEPLVKVKGKGKMELLSAIESTDPLICHTAQDLKRRAGEFSKVGKAEALSYDLGNETILYQVSPLPRDIGLDWLIVVAVPREDFMDHINANTRWTILFCILAALLATIIGVILTQRMTNPLKNLAHLTKELVTQGFSADSPAEQGIKRITGTIWEEAGNLAGAFTFMLGELQNYITRVKETTAAKERIESELRVGREIQMSVLPQDFPPFPGRKEFELHAHIEPAKEMSGDFFDFYMIDRNHIYFTIGDVSGKGVPASLLMVTCRTLLEAMANAGVADPAEILTKVNTEIVRKNEAMLFVTVFYGILDVVSGELRYGNAGHNPPYVLRTDGRVEELAPGPKPPPALGVLDDYVYPLGSLQLAPGDCFFMYTDGVTEAMNLQHNQFTEQRLEKLLRSAKDAPPVELIRLVVTAVKEFAGEAPQSDDITALAIRYWGVPDANAPQQQAETPAAAG